MLTASTANPALISVVVPVWNAQPFVAAGVDSLLATGYPRLEVLLIDDGSTDGSWAECQRLAEAHPGAVTALQYPDRGNHGASQTRNLGLRVARGELICFLDADDVVYRHRFDAAAPILAERPEIDAVYEATRVVCVDENESQTWRYGEVVTVPPNLSEMDLLRHLLSMSGSWHTDAITFRKTLLEKTGLFDHRLPVTQDTNMWLRFCAVGRLAAGNLSEPVAEYRRRTGSLFRVGPSNRIGIIPTVGYFRKWLLANGVRDERLDATNRILRSHVDRSLIAFREQRERGLLFKTILCAVQQTPACLLQRRFWGHLIYGAMGR